MASLAHHGGMSVHEATHQSPWVPDLSTFGERLAVVRQRMHWNVKEAAAACGLPAQSWRNWERGVRCQDLQEVCAAISRATGADFDWLMRGSATNAIRRALARAPSPSEYAPAA